MNTLLLSAAAHCFMTLLLPWHPDVATHTELLQIWYVVHTITLLFTHLEDPGGDGPDLVDEAAANLAPGAGLRVIAQALLVPSGAALNGNWNCIINSSKWRPVFGIHLITYIKMIIFLAFFLRVIPPHAPGTVVLHQPVALLNVHPVLFNQFHSGKEISR